jgi:hypothetical protein
MVHFKIGEVAAMFDISIRAIRLYDKMRLFSPKHTYSEGFPDTLHGRILIKK